MATNPPTQMLMPTRCKPKEFTAIAWLADPAACPLNATGTREAKPIAAHTATLNNPRIRRVVIESTNAAKMFSPSICPN